MTFKKVEPETWRPDKEGESIIGVLLKVDHEVGKFKSNVYNIESELGNLVIVWGSTVLDRKMAYTKIGDLIKITFKGTEPSKSGEDTKLFDVEIDYDARS